MLRKYGDFPGKGRLEVVTKHADYVAEIGTFVD